MKRKLLSLMVVMAMLFGMAVPAYAAEGGAADGIQCKTYLTEETAFNGSTATRVTVPGEDLAFFNGQGSATWTATFKTTNTGLQSLMVVNGPTDDRNYISFYLNSGSRLGIEIRNASSNDHRYVDTANFADGEWHTATFTVSENQYYRFYLDQELVFNVSAASTNFVKNIAWEPASVTLGGANRAGNGPNNYLFNGAIKDVKMYNGALSEEEILNDHGFVPPAEVPEAALDYTHMSFDGTSGSFVFDDGAVDTLKAMDKGTLSFVYKLNESAYDDAIVGLFSLSNKDAANEYGTLYLKPKTNRIGIEVRNGSAKEFAVPAGLDLKDGKWHTVTYVYTGAETAVYLDGEQAGTGAFTGLFSNASWAGNANAVTIGGMRRTDPNNNTWPFDGAILNAQVYAEALSAEQVGVLHTPTAAANQESYADGTFKTQEYGLYDLGDFDAFNYRIPSLVTLSDGTLLAAADQRNQHWNDNGDIDSVVRRSTDGGKTWSGVIDIIDLKSQVYNTSQQSAYTIDPALMVETQGEHKDRVWMLVDMFPECSGTWAAQNGSGYSTIDGKQYLNLFDAAGNLYTVREEGKVYDKDGQLTEYAVKQNAPAPYHEMGDLYQNGEYVGNIYLKSTNAGNDTAPLTIYVTDHLWLNYSDDGGLTWSEPVSLNAQVKKDWMRFLGAGPGVGIQLQDGTLMFPVYYTNENNFQSSANIYSTDGGATWTMGDSPNEGRTKTDGTPCDTSTINKNQGISELTESQIVELNNGHLMQFMRNTGGNGKVVYSVSTDKGKTWGPVIDTTAPDVYCQLSVVHYPELVDGKEIIIMSNPGGGGRNNGTLRVGEIGEDDTVTWTTTKMFRPGVYAYSCLTVMPDGTLGLMYEHRNTIKYTSFNLNFLSDPVNLLNPNISSVSKEVTKGTDTTKFIMAGDTLTFHVGLNQTVFTAGKPQLRFQIGGENRYAEFVSGGVADRELTFRYVVQEGDQGNLSFRPKIVGDEANAVQNVYGMDVSSVDEMFSIGYIGRDPSDSDKDIPLDNITATAGNNQSGQGPEKVLDRDETTLWHTTWGGSPRSQHYITLNLGQAYMVDGLRYQPRQAGGINGIITKYRIEVSLDGTNFTPVATGDWAGNSDWKEAAFTPVKAQYVKLVSLESQSQEAGNEYTSAAEIRVTGTEVSTDTEAPTAPANVKAENITETGATLIWDASSDNVGVTGYVVKNGDAQVAALGANVLSYNVDGLTANTQYTFNVFATDAAGNVSAAGSVTFTTKAPVVTDKTALNEAIARAAALDSADSYTEASYQAVTAALAAANLVAGNAAATQQQVNEATETLNTAIDSLVKASTISGVIKDTEGNPVAGAKVTLAPVSRADGGPMTTVTDAGGAYSFRRVAVGTYQLTAEVGGVTSAPVTVAANEMVTTAPDITIDRPSVNKSTLEAVLNLAKAHSDEVEGLIPSAQEMFNKVLDKAQAVYDSAASTQDEVDKAWKDLMNAIHALGFVPGEKAELIALIAQAQAMDITGYQDGAEKEAFEAALQAAVDIRGDADAMQADIDAALKALQTAIDNLIPVETAGDKTELRKVIATAEGYDLNDYVQDEKAIADFNAALAAANVINDKTGATQSEIDGARLNLITAMTKLRLRADKASLNEWLEKLKAIDLSQYTVESADAVRAAIASAEALAAQDLGTDEMYLIQAEILKMQLAEAGLQPADKEPEDPKDDESGKPEEPSEPTDPKDVNSSKTDDGSKAGDTSSKKEGGKTPTTGDGAPIAILSLLAAATAGVMLAIKKRKD